MHSPIDDSTQDPIGELLSLSNALLLNPLINLQQILGNSLLQDSPQQTLETWTTIFFKILFVNI